MQSMDFTFRSKYSLFVLPSNILGIKWIEKTLDLFASLLVTSCAMCPVFYSYCSVTGNGQSSSRDRKNLIGCYWKCYHNCNFYQITCITIIVIFFRGYVEFYALLRQSCQTQKSLKQYNSITVFMTV